MRTIAEGRAANNATLNSMITHGEDVVSPKEDAQLQFQTDEMPATAVKAQEGRAPSRPPRQSSHEETLFRPIVSSAESITSAMAVEEHGALQEDQADVSTDSQGAKNEFVHQGVSKKTKFLNMQSQVALKDYQKMQVKVESDASLRLDNHS